MQQSIAFSSRGAVLEGIVTLPESPKQPHPGVVLCHSHPFFGQSMASSIMVSICQALAQEGIVALRFNFRGVGGSGGSFDRGKGEQEDLKAALSTLKKWPGV